MKFLKNSVPARFLLRITIRQNIGIQRTGIIPVSAKTQILKSQGVIPVENESGQKLVRTHSLVRGAFQKKRVFG
jgi:hypothetical protein